MQANPARTVALALPFLLASGFGASAADIATFTWNPSGASPALPGPAFTADSIQTTDYLFNYLGEDTYIMQINGIPPLTLGPGQTTAIPPFTLGGTAVPVTGLNTSYGLYIEGRTAVSPAQVYGPGTFSLMLDPTDNDGTPSTTWNSATQTGGISWSNPAGAADDITLATGTLLTGSFGTQANGNLGINIAETFVPEAAQAGFFLSPDDDDLFLDQTFFNTATSRVTGTDDSGNAYILVNGGYGIVNLQVPEPPSMTLYGAGLLGLLGLRRVVKKQPTW